MLKTLKNAWGIEELRKKILFTLFIILVYRLGNAVPVPYVNTAMLESYFNTVNNTILGLWNTMSGGSFSMATIFALSIQPYINASIIIQLLTIAIPALERLQKEGGEEGRKKIASITRSMFSVTPRPGLSGTSRYPSFICGASSSRFWPSCQIQCVSSAVGFPDAAAATCANVVSVMSKWLFEWLPHVSPQSFRIDAIRRLPSSPQKCGSASTMSTAFSAAAW